jgi:Major Facilitator Superfamily
VRPDKAPTAGRREWIGLAVLALACVLYSIDLTVLHLAVPALSADLQPSSVQLLWIVDIYGFMLAGSLITMGTLGDRIGRRRLLLIGAAAFGAASPLAAFSTSAEMLIAARALLGVRDPDAGRLDPADRAPHSPGLRDQRRPGARGGRLCPHDAGRPGLWAPGARDCVGYLLAR